MIYFMSKEHEPDKTKQHFTHLIITILNIIIAPISCDFLLYLVNNRLSCSVVIEHGLQKH